MKREVKTTQKSSKRRVALFALSLGVLSAVCTGFGYSPLPRHRAGSAVAYSDSSRPGDARIEDRLRRTILPLLGIMDRPCRPDELRVQIMNEPTINAANAGGCQFFVTNGGAPPVPTPVPTPSQTLFTSANIYLIALNDNGATGPITFPLPASILTR